MAQPPDSPSPDTRSPESATAAVGALYYLIVTDALRARYHSKAHFADVDAGMLVDGHYTPLPWSENTFTAAW
jgi:hypothetical protein